MSEWQVWILYRGPGSRLGWHPVLEFASEAQALEFQQRNEYRDGYPAFIKELKCPRKVPRSSISK